MLDEIIPLMTHPKWHEVLGDRPLVPVLWPMKFKTMLEAQPSESERMTLAGLVQHVRARAKVAGLGDPYIVAQEIVHTYKHAAVLEAAGFDAISDYAPAYGGGTKHRDDVPSYTSATQSLLDYYDTFLLGSMPFVPAMTLQYYPWPRATTDKAHHYGLPEPGDIAQRMQLVFEYAEDHPDTCESQTVFMYSWNEHSEGGGCAPPWAHHRHTRRCAGSWMR